MGEFKQKSTLMAMEKKQRHQSLLKDKVGEALKFIFGIRKIQQRFQKDISTKAPIFFDEFTVKDESSSSDDDSSTLETPDVQTARAG